MKKFQINKIFERANIFYNNYITLKNKDNFYEYWNYWWNRRFRKNINLLF